MFDDDLKARCISRIKALLPVLAKGLEESPRAITLEEWDAVHSVLMEPDVGTLLYANADGTIRWCNDPELLQASWDDYVRGAHPPATGAIPAALKSGRIAIRHSPIGGFFEIALPLRPKDGMAGLLDVAFSRRAARRKASLLMAAYWGIAGCSLWLLSMPACAGLQRHRATAFVTAFLLFVLAPLTVGVAPVFMREAAETADSSAAWKDELKLISATRAWSPRTAAEWPGMAGESAQARGAGGGSAQSAFMEHYGMGLRHYLRGELREARREMGLASRCSPRDQASRKWIQRIELLYSGK